MFVKKKKLYVKNYKHLFKKFYIIVLTFTFGKQNS